MSLLLESNRFLVYKYKLTFDFLTLVKGQQCLNCGEEFSESSLKIVFTHSAKLDMGNEFKDLSTVNVYAEIKN
jgi:hypothetical protein